MTRKPFYVLEYQGCVLAGSFCFGLVVITWHNLITSWNQVGDLVSVLQAVAAVVLTEAWRIWMKAARLNAQREGLRMAHAIEKEFWQNYLDKVKNPKEDVNLGKEYR